MLALFIRQPYAELILRGIKTVEFAVGRRGSSASDFISTRPAKWAARRTATVMKAWSLDLAMANGGWHRLVYQHVRIAT